MLAIIFDPALASRMLEALRSFSRRPLACSHSLLSISSILEKSKQFLLTFYSALHLFI